MKKYFFLGKRDHSPLNKKGKGFTLIELLVVVAIIGLLSTLAVVALNAARQNSRDAKRVADIKQVQTALELYYNDFTSYPPDDGSELILGVEVVCLDQNGFSATNCPTENNRIYMGQLPQNPEPGGITYAYSALSAGAHCTAEPCPTYRILFELEGRAGELQGPGTFEATPEGIIKQ